MESLTSEDVRKKRDSREVVEEDGRSPDEHAKEKPKKLRARLREAAAAAQHASHHNAVAVHRKGLTALSVRPPSESNLIIEKAGREESDNNFHPGTTEHDDVVDEESGKCWDLESALHHLLRIGDGCKEFISEDTWISFRVGDAGDASTLACCYRMGNASRSKLSQGHGNGIRMSSGASTVVPCSPNTEFPEKPQSTVTKTKPATPNSTIDEALEVRLAEGLGDEDSPPFVFALLVDMFNDTETDKKTQQAVAAALLTSEEPFRTLHVQWLYIDPHLKDDLAGLVERRLWLRLSVLAIMVCCDLQVRPQRVRT